MSNGTIRKNIDLKIVSLNPIYADPDSTSPNIDLGLYSIGSRGPDTLLSFRGYNGKSISSHLFGCFDFATRVGLFCSRKPFAHPNINRSLPISGGCHWISTHHGLVGCPRPLFVPIANVLARLDIDILIQQDKATTWRGRVQLWNFQKNQSGPSRNRNSMVSNRDQRLSGVQSRASRTSSSVQTSHSSVMSFQTRTSELTAVTSVLASENTSGIGIDARTFEPPKQPLLVLFLRSRRQRTREVGQLTLMKIPSKLDGPGFISPPLTLSSQWERNHSI